MKTALYPGSFDPVTFGHLDIVGRAAKMFDRLLVGVARNDGKSPLFSLEDRLAMLEESTRVFENVEVTSVEGLLIEFARTHEVFTVVRGLRAVSDFEFEFQMALMNRRLEPKLETVFLTPSEDCTFLSSRLVKEVARLGGDVAPFVPKHVVERLQTRFQKRINNP